jgi:hypothetical protein
MERNGKGMNTKSNMGGGHDDRQLCLCNPRKIVYYLSCPLSMWKVTNLKGGKEDDKTRKTCRTSGGNW